MTFEEGYKKILEQKPDEMEVSSMDGEPLIELKLDEKGFPTGEIYFCLEDVAHNIYMNVKFSQDAEILEAYPLCTQEDFKKYNFDNSIVQEGTYPYFSIDGEGVPTHIYYIDKNSGTLTRKSLTKNTLREYDYFFFDKEDLPGVSHQIFQRYNCTYVATYHSVGDPTPVAYLIGISPLSTKYQSLKAHLFQLINYNII